MKLNKKTVLVILAIVFCFNTFPLLGVSAADTANPGFTIIVDYYAEALRVIPYDGKNAVIEVATAGDSAKYKGDATDNYEPKYMYSLKVLAPSLLEAQKSDKQIKTLYSEKWYPIYGDGIDISGYIPKKDPGSNLKKQYNIAVRRADDTFTVSKGYSTRQIVTLAPRYDDKNLKKSITYNAEYECFELASGYAMSLIYMADHFPPLETKDVISVKADYYSAGGNVTIKTAPKTNAAGTAVINASSVSYKFKIPKRPSQPTVKADDSKKSIVSLKKNTLEWSSTGGTSDSDVWTPYTGTVTSIKYTELTSSEFSRAFTQDTIRDDGNVAIYFRTKAVTGKTPASEPKEILIPYDLLSEEN